MQNNFEESQTYENLKKSFNQEASLFFKYLFFKSVAEYEGQDKLAEIIKKMTDGGADVVLGSFDFLRQQKDPVSGVPLGSTQKNLNSLIHIEAELSSEIYPMMAQVAREEGFSDVASWFDTLEKLKKNQVQNLKKAQNG